MEQGQLKEDTKKKVEHMSLPHAILAGLGAHSIEQFIHSLNVIEWNKNRVINACRLGEPSTEESCWRWHPKGCGQREERKKDEELPREHHCRC